MPLYALNRNLNTGRKGGVRVHEKRRENCKMQDYWWRNWVQLGRFEDMESALRGAKALYPGSNIHPCRNCID